MLLSEYIETLQGMLAEIGDTNLLFTSVDDEGNGYNRASYAPEFRYLSSHEDNEYRPKSLISIQGEGETLQEWLDNNCLDEEDVAGLKKVILL